jgi:hypothetical protein
VKEVRKEGRKRVKDGKKRVKAGRKVKYVRKEGEGR